MSGLGASGALGAVRPGTVGFWSMTVRCRMGTAAGAGAGGAGAGAGGEGVEVRGVRSFFESRRLREPFGRTRPVPRRRPTRARMVPFEREWRARGALLVVASDLSAEEKG